MERWSGFLTYERVADITKMTARLLAEGAVVGWVQGRSEFGPRALGNRSILADPRPSENRLRINQMIKKRESIAPLRLRYYRSELLTSLKFPWTRMNFLS